MKHKIYCILGLTETGSLLGIGFSNNLNDLIKLFVEKYPHFQGKGSVLTQIAKTDSQWDYNVNVLGWKIFKTFSNTRELKKYLGE